MARIARRRDRAVRRGRARAARGERTTSRSLLTRPDAPAGRGRRLGAPPAKDVAERLGIPVLQPDRPAPGLELGAPTVVVCAYGLLIPRGAARPSGSWLNVHPSLLPRWRGAAPVERAIMAGDGETGVTIHETVAELDAGPIAAQRGVPDRRRGRRGRRLRARGARSRRALLDDVLAHPAPTFAPQAERGRTYAAKIGPDDRRSTSTGPAGRARAHRARAQPAHRRARRARRAAA